jgi:UDP-N-acetylmuramoyl-L-alanyl-D-glutamate--2,6-diaminopimelate ligase
MEVSSHALSQNRVTGSKFKAVAFTNLTQDHLDFHGSMDRYYQAKKSLFTFEYAEKGFINIDGDFGNQLVNDSEIPIATISKYNHKANWYYEAAVPTSSGYEVSIRGIGGVLISGKLPLFGEYNLENAIMAIALAVESGLDPIFVGTQMQAMKGASGRLEPINLGQSFAAFVDYAHSPDSVTRVLETAKAFTAGKVIAVLGCGGDRDVTKRPLMGAALSNGSDIAIFTSDNPRSEAPQVILDSMTAGLKVSAPSKVIENRSSAIEYAVSLAKPGDTVLLLGKGHEIGQEIAGVIHSFDDRIELARVIEGKS